MLTEESTKEDVIQDRSHCVNGMHSILYFVICSNDASDKRHSERGTLGPVFRNGKNSSIWRDYHSRGGGYPTD